MTGFHPCSNVQMKTAENSIPLNLIYGLITALIGVSFLVFVVKTDEISKPIAIVGTILCWGVLGFFAYKLNYWRGLSIWLLVFTLYQGFLGEVPRLVILNETIRNLYFHVTMWFAMLFLLLTSVIYSIAYLSNNRLKNDIYAQGAAEAGTVMGVLGLVTGSIWARFTWGEWWHWDPKQVYTGIGLLLYLAYFILRGSFEDETKRARIASVLNVFAFPSLVVLIYILPRMMTSTHPGQDDNPAFSDYSLNGDMKIVFYPAIVGWTLMATWIASIKIRTRVLEQKLLDQ